MKDKLNNTHEQVYGSEPITIPIKLDGKNVNITYNEPIFFIDRIDISHDGKLIPVVNILGSPDKDGIIYTIKD